MARDMAPIVKRSRREKMALHPKAIKGMTKRPYAPGEHGQMSGRSKPSEYAIQLREKQKVKRIYGVMERQFAKLVSEAAQKAGVAGENLVQMLELRMDNAVYRLGLAPSRRAARQLVTHGHFLLNGRRVDIPSIRLKLGDEFEVRAKSQSNAYFKASKDTFSANRPSLSWLSLDPKKLKAKVTGLPKRDEVQEEISEQLIIEFYSR
jgi:small subunit ribosomal protein S4